MSLNSVSIFTTNALNYLSGKLLISVLLVVFFKLTLALSVETVMYSHFA